MTAKRIIGLGVVCSLLLILGMAVVNAQTYPRKDTKTTITNYYVNEDGYNKLRLDIYRAKYEHADQLIELRREFESLMDDWLMTLMYREEAKVSSSTPKYYSDNLNFDIDHMTLRKLEGIRETTMLKREDISPVWSAKMSQLVGLRQAIDNTDMLLKEIRNDIKRIEGEVKSK